jgi:hypothetical protein
LARSYEQKKYTEHSSKSYRITEPGILDGRENSNSFYDMIVSFFNSNKRPRQSIFPAGYQVTISRSLSLFLLFIYSSSTKFVFGAAGAGAGTGAGGATGGPGGPGRGP